jgi:hypothetical protein
MVTYIFKYSIYMYDRLPIKYIFGTKHVRTSNESWCHDDKKRTWSVSIYPIK